MSKEASTSKCDHKFIDSNHCLKCGWSPNETKAAVPGSLERSVLECRKCGSQMERRPNMFYWRGRYFHGLVCVKDNALYDDPTDSFMQHVSGHSNDQAQARCPQDL